MLKKILLIFCTLCLVFSFTVPCFAYQSYTFEQKNTNAFYYTYNATLYTFTMSNYTVGFSATSNSFTCRDGAGDGNFDFAFTIDPSLYTFVSFTFSSSAQCILYLSDRNVRLNSGEFYSFVFHDVSTLRFKGSDGGFITLTNFNCIPVDESFSTDTIISYGLNPQSYIPTSTQYLNTTFLNLYSDLAHVFDFVPEITTTYFQPFIIGSGIVAILVFIFLTVFMIKRFTGGNT